MRRFVIIFLLAALSILHCTAPPLLWCGEAVQGKESPDSSVATPETTGQEDQEARLEKDFKQATDFFTELKNDKERILVPANWAIALENFQTLHDRQPKSGYAAASLFMLGRINYSRYQQFHNVLDLDKSVESYQEVVALFPWHALADDSLLTLGRIQLEDKKDPQEAAKNYARITTEYHTGDLTDKATEKLNFLAKKYNIPLPPPVEPISAVISQSPPEETQAAEVNPATDPAPTTGTTDLPNVKTRAYVRPVEHWSSENYTRIVIKTSRPVTYREELLEKQGEQPRRLFIDFDKSYIEPKYRAPIPIKDGLLQQVRTAQFTPDTVRVVLDIESIKSYKIYSLPDPFRVIVDVHGQISAESSPAPSKSPTETAVMATPDKETTPRISGREAEADAAAPTTDESSLVNNQRDTQTEKSEKPLLILQDYKKVKISGKPKQAAPELNAPLTSPSLSLAQQLNLGVRRIVIDPGHGGKDPGASAFGMNEKDIVLRMAKKLAAQLKQELGCEVILTRNEDVFISLEERTAIANANSADLFISLHLNAHSSAKIFGFETYYLNLSTDPEAIRVAALENATSTHQLSDLQTILSDIMKNSKIDESSRLAKQVQDALISGLADRKFQQIKSLGVKQAPFYVLIGAEMPAILIEMAFISNKTDAQQVKKESYQDALAAEITKGLQKYIRTITASR
jgi:N-acetylmuramoyl-L-alanine amidase